MAIRLCIMLTSSLVAFVVSAQPRSSDFRSLENVVVEEMAATGTPGAAVAVVVGDRVVFIKGFGIANIETGSSVTPDTLFRIASTTKMLTAAAVVTAAERGAVDLQVPIGRYIKGLSPRISKVSLHQLLSHTAGLRDGFSFHGPHDDAALGEFVRSWTDDYLIAEPGEIFSYSNLGYVLAGYVLEQVTGKSYADAMEVLFTDLGMRRSTLRPLVAMTHVLSQGHDTAPDQSSAVIVRPFADDTRYWPNGGVFTTVNDFARFAIALINGGMLEGRAALSPSVVARLSTSHADMPGDIREPAAHGYGLNIRSNRGARFLQHGGSRLGFASVVRFVPEHRAAVIILANRTDAVLTKSLEKATEIVVPLKPQPDRPALKSMPVSEAELERYVGVYANAPDYLRLEIVRSDGKLFLKQPGQAQQSEMTKIGEGRFTAAGQMVALIGGRDATVKYLHIAGHALRRIE